MSEKVFPYKEADKLIESETSGKELLNQLQFNILSELEFVSGYMDDVHMQESINELNISITALIEYLINKEVTEEEK